MAGLLGVARELRSGQSMEWHTQENWTLQSTGQSRENWPDRRYGAEFAFNQNTGSMSTRLCKGLLRWHSEENQTKNEKYCGQHSILPLGQCEFWVRVERIG